MRCYRTWRRLPLLALALVVLCFRLGPAWAQLPPAADVFATPEMKEDAQLNDVFFWDSDEGWAVGDRGVILHTEDGGRHWEAQRLSSSCHLQSVHFIDHKLGWVVGGWIHPYTHRTSCLVARTQDGGRNWTIIPSLTLPALKHVQFLDARHGWAVGTASTLYPTGVFRTEDGGRSWTTLPAGMSGKWTTAAFIDPQHGLLAGQDGQLAVVSAPRIVSSRTPDVGRRPLREACLLDGRYGWLVGDGGLVMQTGDAGLTWQGPTGVLPTGVADLFDFRCIASTGSHVWIAGTPGTMVLYSPDQGQSWQLQRTDQRVPLQAMTFADQDRGWAVGALGTILATRDGGRTWRRQRSGGTRAALLGIFSEANQVPLELFALQSGEEGFLGVAEILNRRDAELVGKDDASLEDQAQEALTAVGASGADQCWQFPLRQEGLRLRSEDIMAIWDRANDGRGVAMLEERIVRKIRQWRPEVIVTEGTGHHSSHPLAHLLSQMVLSAVNNAADPTSYPDHATLAGLEPWSVKKVYCITEDADEATVQLTTARLATRLGRSVSEHAADGYALVRAEHQPGPVSIGFRLLLDRLPQASGRSNIFSGIYLQPGGEARRSLTGPATRNLETLTRLAQKRRNIEQLFERTSDESVNADAWLGQVQDLTRALHPTSAGQLVFQLGQRYRDAGRMEMAAQALEDLVERYPAHPLTETALVWLVQYYASSEMAWQLRQGTRFDTALASTRVTNTRVAQGVVQADFAERRAQAIESATGRTPGGRTPEDLAADELQSPEFGVVQTGIQVGGSSQTAGSQFDTTQRAEKALFYLKMIQAGRPELFAKPYVQFPAAIAYRAKGLSRDAERFYHRWGASPVPSDWERCAQAELWLSHGRGVCPKPTCVCRIGGARPHLDGKLDDPIWKSAEPLELHSPLHDDGSWPAGAMVACDDQFFYVAVSCRKVPGQEYSSTPGPRPRDPDLLDRDRVELLIDIDRDYTSFYRLVVDHRGWTGEVCMGNVHWNPTWYVAAADADDQWTIEAAIPLSALTPQTPSQERVWAVGLQRIVPEVGVQSYTQPAAVEPRGEGFALLLFQ